MTNKPKTTPEAMKYIQEAFKKEVFDLAVFTVGDTDLDDQASLSFVQYKGEFMVIRMSGLGVIKSTIKAPNEDLDYYLIELDFTLEDDATLTVKAGILESIQDGLEVQWYEYELDGLSVDDLFIEADVSDELCNIIRPIYKQNFNIDLEDFVD
jgi:hypothetical protein